MSACALEVVCVGAPVAEALRCMQNVIIVVDVFAFMLLRIDALYISHQSSKRLSSVTQIRSSPGHV